MQTNVYFNNEKIMMTPEELKHQFPLSQKEEKSIANSRVTISNIINRRDSRILMICGPCSIHDTESALDYGNRLQYLSSKLEDHLYIVMRVYFEKPRTTVGWKGLINDPYMDESCDIEAGLQIARSLLLKLVKIGLPLATEALDPNSMKYIGDLFSWSSIGARTTESQIHREMASGLLMPVGFKNSTYGSLTVAINAMLSAKNSHRFIGINQSGKVCLLKTSGNSDIHIILRGGKKPNYYPKDILNCEKKLLEAGFPAYLMIDCSHGNSRKDYRRQIDVAQSAIEQIKSENSSIMGLMLESYINSGNQSSTLPRKEMRYGVSITDACLDWESTQKLLHNLHNELRSIV